MCQSTNVKSLGIRFFGNTKKLKYVCNNCSHEFTTDHKDIHTLKNNNVVVTSAIDGVATNEKFFAALKLYCDYHNAKLLILPVNHGKPFNEDRYDDLVRPYLCLENVSMNNVTNIMGAIKLGSTLESPLHGINSFSKGKNVVFGHPQVQLKTLPRKAEKYPAIISTTGTVSFPKYGNNKTAHKANFNHSYSALFIDGENPNIMRHLNYDGVGFYDLDKYFSSTQVEHNKTIDAIVTGDEHVLFYDPEVMEATYGKSGIVSALKPKLIIRHDVLDCYSISHHHRSNVFTKFAKYIGGTDSIEKELNQTLDFIKETTPKDVTSIIIPSNHNNHLLRWLQEGDPKTDLVNAKLYHQLMYLMLSKVRLENNIPKYPDPFHEWAMDKIGKNIKFLTPAESFIIGDIDINNHGDLGINGSRGSNNQYRDLPLKSIIGHSHSPGIEKGSYQVGTSSNLRLDYNKGLSSWHHCHCVIYPNGKRQLIFIIDERWK